MVIKADKAILKKQDINTEFYISERCHIIELSNIEDDPDVSIARARVEPGVTTRWHRLKDTIERYHILSGKGLVEVDDIREEVVAGDTVIIPALSPQRITNIGEEDLIFLAICSPRFTMQAYEDIEAE